MLPAAHAAGDACPVDHPVFSDGGSWSPIAAAARPVKILAIGSSSTAGIGASNRERTYPAQLAALLKARSAVPAIVQNAGVSGETADKTIGRLEKALSGGNYDLVIWQVGTNDAVRGGDLNRFRGEIARGISAAKQAGVRLILLDQQYYPGSAKRAHYEDYVDAVDGLGAETGVAVFSRYAMMKAWAEKNDLLGQMLSPDHFHMNDRGYGCVAALLAGPIAQILPEGPVESAPAPAVTTASAGS